MPQELWRQEKPREQRGVFRDGDKLFVLRTSWNSQDRVVEASLGATGTDPFPQGSLAVGYKCPHPYQEAPESSRHQPGPKAAKILVGKRENWAKIFCKRLESDKIKPTSKDGERQRSRNLSTPALPASATLSSLHLKGKFLILFK